MEQPIAAAPVQGVAAYVGIDWADQKHHVVLRSEAEPTEVQHQVINQTPEALLDWVGEMQQRFASKGKILVCLEQSRGGLIYHLMGYEFFELYPINPNQLANSRAIFKNSGAKDDRPDADLLCELVMCHRDRLKAWKPDTELTRKLATLNEDRRQAATYPLG
jgi:transposase